MLEEIGKDLNKGDETHPGTRCRLIAQEIKRKDIESMFAEHQRLDW